MDLQTNQHIIILVVEVRMDLLLNGWFLRVVWLPALGCSAVLGHGKEVQTEN